jgi:serpin B
MGEPGTPDVEVVVDGNAQFALDLYDRLRRTPGNLFFSPYSISTALAMTYAGARGNTERQMAQTLHFVLDQGRLHPAFASLETSLNAVQEKGHVQLSVANALWPQRGYPFLDEYLALVKEFYGVLITAVDYAGDPEAARLRINAWVEERTANKVRDLIPAGLLDGLVRLVLTNAVYFKGDWAHQFESARTKKEPFWVTPNEKVMAPLMAQQGEFRYAETASLQILELPYAGQDLSMLVLLPRSRDGLAELENGLTVENLQGWARRLWPIQVQVTLPRFKTTSQFRLAATLAAMGMPDAFDQDKANFAGMDGRTLWLYISAVLHKAFVDVNEEGTEAAAATAVVMRARSAPAPPAVFRADHPFVFLIVDHRTGSILFLGRLVDPTPEPAYGPERRYPGHGGPER